MINNHLAGQAAELYVAARLAERGYEVALPLLTQSRYDLLISKGGEFDRVQVKKATLCRTGTFAYLQARLSSRNKHSKPLYAEGEFEFFAFTDMDRVWLAPFKELAGCTSVCLGSTNPAYRRKTAYDPERWLQP